MGSHSRTKGRRGENEFVAKCRFYGYEAERISEAGMPGPDVKAFGRWVEVKRRKRLAAKLRRWSGMGAVLVSAEDVPTELGYWCADAQIVAVREDLGYWYLFMDLDEYLDLTEDTRIVVPHEGPWYIWMRLEQFCDRVDEHINEMGTL